MERLPKGENIIVWETHDGRTFLTPFKCGAEALEEGSVEGEFPRCLDCKDFLDRLDEIGIGSGHVVDVWSKDIIFLRSKVKR